MGAENNWTWPPSMDAVVAASGSHPKARIRSRMSITTRTTRFALS
jgi:hypothetical protein